MGGIGGGAIGRDRHVAADGLVGHGQVAADRRRIGGHAPVAVDGRCRATLEVNVAAQAERDGVPRVSMTRPGLSGTKRKPPVPGSK